MTWSVCFSVFQWYSVKAGSSIDQLLFNYQEFVTDFFSIVLWFNVVGTVSLENEGWQLIHSVCFLFDLLSWLSILRSILPYKQAHYKIWSSWSNQNSLAQDSPPFQNVHLIFGEPGVGVSGEESNSSDRRLQSLFIGSQAIFRPTEKCLWSHPFQYINCPDGLTQFEHTCEVTLCGHVIFIIISSLSSCIHWFSSCESKPVSAPFFPVILCSSVPSFSLVWVLFVFHLSYHRPPYLDAFFHCFLSSYFSHLFRYLCHPQLILISSLFFHPPSLCLFPCTSSHILPSNLDLLFPAFISYTTSPPGWCWFPILYSSPFSFPFIMPPQFLFSPLVSPSFFFFSPSHIEPFPFLSPVQAPCQKP